MHLKKLCQVVTGVIAIVTLFACSDAAQQASDPNTPRGTQALSGDSEVVLSWAPVEGAEKYIVCWAYVEIKDCSPDNPRVIYKDDVGVLDTETNRIVWTHTGITNDTFYQYVIIAYAASWGNSTISVNVDGAPQGVGINPPAVVSVSGNGDVATISWAPVSGATNYHLYMASETNINKGNYSTLPNGMTQKFLATELSYQSLSLTLGLTYYFVVTAEKDFGDGVVTESIESQEVIMIPKVRDTADDGYLPVDFTVSSGDSVIQTDGTLRELISFDWSNPCPLYPNSNIFSVYWSTVPFSSKPAVCENTVNCVPDLTVATSNQVLDYLDAGTNYYFSILTAYSNFCQDGDSFIGETFETQLSPNISIKTISTPVNSLIVTATPLENAVLIEIDTSMQDSTTSKYNLYMAANNFCSTFTSKNYKDDTVWGMVHTDIPTPLFKHVALPGGIPFCFIVTSVNQNGVENQASNVIFATPL